MNIASNTRQEIVYLIVISLRKFERKQLNRPQKTAKFAKDLKDHEIMGKFGYTMFSAVFCKCLRT